MLDNCYSIEDNFRSFDFKKCWFYLQELGQKKYGSKFILNINDKKTIYKLISYAVCAEATCELYEIDLKKGILLLGPVGCGKTSLITLMNEFSWPHLKYSVASTRFIAAQYHKDGYEVIHRYGCKNKVICLDDLGVEQNIKHFGNECNTTAEILLHRYDMYVNYGILTHATTNLNANELEKIYGNRVRSRLRTMFNLISFPMETKDKRK